jgi:hypothetical protein
MWMKMWMGKSDAVAPTRSTRSTSTRYKDILDKRNVDELRSRVAKDLWVKSGMGGQAVVKEVFALEQSPAHRNFSTD